VDNQPIYKRYAGKRFSEQISIFRDGAKYIFVYQKFKRTNPSQTERAKGFKPQRVLLSEFTHHFDQIEGMDFKDFPFFHLLDGFLKPKTKKMHS